MARILIADGSKTIRQALRCLLTSQGFDVVGEAADGVMAVELARRLKPDVIILDASLGGAEATREIMRERPTACVIGLGWQEQAADSMLDAGAAAFVPKGSDTQLLLDAIWQRDNGVVGAVGNAQ
jgi:DNA-binding NarL/FixJ family response regulator